MFIVVVAVVVLFVVIVVLVVVIIIGKWAQTPHIIIVKLSYLY